MAWHIVSRGFQSTLPRGERRSSEPPYRRLPYFNPRSHEGSDCDCDTKLGIYCNFNPRSHEGSDTVRTSTCALSILFQSTLPRGERHSNIVAFAIRYDFNPRSHEGSDAPAPTTTSPAPNFNPRSHEGSDDVRFFNVRDQFRISIHAPTRGATPHSLIYTECSFSISIHAPTRGATSNQCPVNLETGISIHAPTRGATDRRKLG